MKEYPFSGMSPDRALEFFWTEFMAYKNSTDKRIAALNQQIQELEIRNKELLKIMDNQVNNQLNKEEALREMIDPQYAEEKRKKEEENKRIRELI